jgi:hypothetical protein
VSNDSAVKGSTSTANGEDRIGSDELSDDGRETKQRRNEKEPDGGPFSTYAVKMRSTGRRPACHGQPRALRWNVRGVGRFVMNWKFVAALVVGAVCVIGCASSENATPEAPRPKRNPTYDTQSSDQHNPPPAAQSAKTDGATAPPSSATMGDEPPPPATATGAGAGVPAQPSSILGNPVPPPATASGAGAPAPPSSGVIVHDVKNPQPPTPKK